MALHEAMLMNLYCSYGAASSPLFIPSGSLMCTCGEDTSKNPDDETTAVVDSPGPEANARRALTFA
jgi:hypothetical protein